jgi:hypothetical protein
MNNMSTQHTPGPWGTDHKDHDSPYQNIKIKAGSKTVCTIWIDDAPDHAFNSEQEANARLIAAAPDLLEALQNLVNGNGFAPSESLEKARAALAKAETP